MTKIYAASELPQIEYEVLECLECEEEPVTAGELYHEYGLIHDYGLEAIHTALSRLVLYKCATQVLSAREVYLITRLGRDVCYFRENTARET